MKNLRLDRPLVCFDLETTGIDVNRDRIVQIAIIRVEPDGSQRHWESLVNPQMAIPAGASAIHGIYDDDVADAPILAHVAAEIHRLFEGADVSGFNSIRFDLPFLNQELERVGRPLPPAERRHLDAMRIFHKKEKRTLAAALRFYCGEELEGAHNALADTTATLAVLDAQIGRYDDLPRDVAGLHGFCNEDEGRYVDSGRKFEWDAGGEAVLRFGKHRGRTLRAMVADERGYLEWMTGSDFPAEVKEIIGRALDGKFPEKG